MLLLMQRCLESLGFNNCIQQLHSREGGTRFARASQFPGMRKPSKPQGCKVTKEAGSQSLNERLHSMGELQR